MNEVLLWLTTAIREHRRWHRSSVRRPDGLRVYYGYETLPTAHQVASGGLVKTQDLQAVFPNNRHNPNLLYLISSALPAYAPRMAQYARRAGAKVVLNQNGVAYPAWHGAGWERMNAFMRNVLREADYVFYQSTFCKQGSDRYLQVRDDRCEVLNNPVDTAFFRPAATPLPANPVRLLLAGSHHDFYRVRTAVDTLQQLRATGLDVALEIAGRFCWRPDAGEAERELTTYIREQKLPGNVKLTGPYTQEQAQLMFQRAHILLHTKYNDPCPRLVVEAMASGLPVVYSASGGTPELVGGESGIGVPAPLDWEQDHPPAPECLAAAVRTVLDSYPRYSLAARTHAVTAFDVKPWIERHREVFTRLLKGDSLEQA